MFSQITEFDRSQACPDDVLAECVGSLAVHSRLIMLFLPRSLILRRIAITLDVSPQLRCSVIIPSYNRLNVLPKAVASVLAQNETDFELIIVDYSDR